MATNNGSGITQQATLKFLKRMKLYEEQKPYRLFYANPGIPQTNQVIEDHVVPITDIRGCGQEFSIEKNGFEILHISPPSYRDCIDSKDRREYPHIEREPIAAWGDFLLHMVRSQFGADEAVMIDYRYRKSHPEFPLAPAEPYQYGQPATTVHIDTTTKDTTSKAVAIFYNSWPKFVRYWIWERATTRFIWVNAWTRIVREGDPVSNQWPLALCDISTMDPAIDLEPSDVVHAKTATEQALVYYHENRGWYFLNSQQPGEMLLFLQSDTAKGSTAVAHASFWNSLALDDEPQRESMEFSLLLKKRATRDLDNRPILVGVAFILLGLGYCMA